MEYLKYEKLNIGMLGHANTCIHDSSCINNTCSTLANRYSDIPVYIFQEVSSTNIIAKGLVTGGEPAIYENGHSNLRNSSTPSGNIICNNFDEAKDTIPHGTVVIADAQTAGRGRLGRSFESPSGTGLYMSIVIRPESIGNKVYDINDVDSATSVDCSAFTSEKRKASPFDPAQVTIAAAVAVVRALRSELGIEADIKWVNDILVNNKKLCGILAEGMINTCAGTLDAVILGIGVNLKTPSSGYPEELAGIITNVEEVLHESQSEPGYKDTSAEKAQKLSNPGDISATDKLQTDWLTLRNNLAAEIASNVLNLLDDYNGIVSDCTASDPDNTSTSPENPLIAEYKKSCSTIGQNILVYKSGLSGEGLPAKAVDIDKDGGLIVQYESSVSGFPGRIETLTFGEISVRSAR